MVPCVCQTIEFAQINEPNYANLKKNMQEDRGSQGKIQTVTKQSNNIMRL